MDRMILKIFFISLTVIAQPILVKAQKSADSIALDPVTNPQLPLDWNKSYDHEGITEICRKLAKTYPHLIKMESIGESPEGRRLWALTVSNFSNADPDLKPALYLDGNIFNNAFQGAEYTLYTAWYLAENFDKNPFVSQLLHTKTLYIVPLVYPDMRDKIIHQPTSRSKASYQYLQDDDADGQVDEDGTNDLNGDGYISFMRRKSPTGRYIEDPVNKYNVVLANPGQKGVYEILGYEGHDNDGDGQINEDDLGYLNPFLNWAWNWQPPFIQPGAHQYPFSLPENRAVKDFVLRHPNIAAVQNFRYRDAFFLPGLGLNQEAVNATEQDAQVYAWLQDDALSLISPFSFKQMNHVAPAVPGGQLDWFYNARGIFSFSNVLFPLMQQKLAQPEQEDKKKNRRKGEEAPKVFLQEGFTAWVPYEHPTYGAIEIGGLRKDFYHQHPTRPFTEEAHHQMISSLYQLFQTPTLEIQDAVKKRLPNGYTEVVVTVANVRAIPTHSNQDLRHQMERPDFITLKDSTVVAGMVLNAAGNRIGPEIKIAPNRIPVPNIPGHGTVKVKWVVKAENPTLFIEADSRKGGFTSRRF